MSSLVVAVNTTTQASGGLTQIALDPSICKFCGSDQGLDEEEQKQHQRNCAEYLKLKNAWLEESLEREGSAKKRTSSAPPDEIEEPPAKAARSEEDDEEEENREEDEDEDEEDEEQSPLQTLRSHRMWWGCKCCEAVSCPYPTNRLPPPGVDDEYDPYHLALKEVDWKMCYAICLSLAHIMIESKTFFGHNKYLGEVGQDEKVKLWMMGKRYMGLKSGFLDKHWRPIRMTVKLSQAAMRCFSTQAVKQRIIGMLPSFSCGSLCCLPHKWILTRYSHVL